MQRTQFDSGFERFVALARLLGLGAYLFVAGVWLFALLNNNSSTSHWPSRRLYEDPAIILFAYFCLAGPIFTLVFSAPIYAIKFLIGGFLKFDRRIDGSEITDTDWQLFKLYTSLDSVRSYSQRVVAWCLILGILYFVDTERNAAAIVRGSNLSENGVHSLSIAVHFLTAFVAVGCRAAIGVTFGIRSQIELEKFFTDRVFGREKAKKILNHIDSVDEEGKSSSAIIRIFRAFRS